MLGKVRARAPCDGHRAFTVTLLSLAPQGSSRRRREADWGSLSRWRDSVPGHPLAFESITWELGRPTARCVHRAPECSEYALDVTEPSSSQLSDAIPERWKN